MTRIQLRRGTASQWTVANPVLADGEMGIETDTNKFKFGNGVTNWNNLDYVITGEVITDYRDLSNLPSINNITLTGNKSASDLGLQEALFAGTGVLISGTTISIDDSVVAMQSDIPDVSNYVTNSSLITTLADYQPLLVSGSTIKTINNQSLLGSGNIEIQSGGTYSEGTGIDITNGVISIDSTVVALKTDIPSLTGYATQTWVTNQGYLDEASIESYLTNEYFASGGYGADTLIPTLTSYWAFDNLATVAFSGSFSDLLGKPLIVSSVNNMLPDAEGNVTIDSATWGNITGTLSNQTDLQNALNTKYDASNPSGYITVSALNGYATENWVGNQGYITSADLPTNYVTTDTAQTISERKTFLGEKAIYFKQVTTANKLGFTLYNPSNGELGAFEYRPGTISGGALLSVNIPATSRDYVGFRYWGSPNTNIVAPKVSGDYYIPVKFTDGTTTVTANTTGTVDISTLLPSSTNFMDLSTAQTAYGTKTFNDLRVHQYIRNSAGKIIFYGVGSLFSIGDTTAELTLDGNTTRPHYYDGTTNSELALLSDMPTVPDIDNTTITTNTNDELQTVAVIDDNSGNAIKTWTGTKAEYDAIVTKDSTTLYVLTDVSKIYFGDTLISNVGNNTLFDFKFADHELNDISWLRADTYSWQSGDVYVTAYNHLVQDIQGVTAETDTINGITVTFYRASDGHKICLADQESVVLNLYNTVGVAWYYILDTANTQFKLPRTKYGFEGLRSYVGSIIRESLPNITGSLGYLRSYATTSGQASGSGALYWSNTTGQTTNGGNNTTYGYDPGFDASRSSSTYQNNAPVQERATQMYLYFFVGDYTQSAIEQTAGLNSELFNNKVDLDGSNMAASVKNFDGQWVDANNYILLNSGTTGTDSYSTYDLSSLLPNDSYNYEISIRVSGNTAGTSGSQFEHSLSSDLIPDQWAYPLCSARVSGSVYSRANGVAIVPVGTGRYVRLYTSGTCYATWVSVAAYRRIGTNS